MEPEGVVDVLRRLINALVPGGVVVDLLSVQPPEQVQTENEVLGELDGSTFFPRSEAAAGGLDTLEDEGLLAHEREERFHIYIRYPNGRELIEDVHGRTYTKMPEALRARLADLDEPCRIRDCCLVRTFRKL